MSYEDSGRLLLSVAMTNIDSFLDEDLPDICEDLGIDLDDFNKNVLRAEIMIVCLWAATKALEGEKQELIETIRNAFFSVFKNERHDELKEVFSQRSKKYDEALDESSEGDQSILSVTILSEMFYTGQLDKSLLDIKAIFLVQYFVFNTMQNVLDSRKQISFIS
jgi:hypothetical protein